MIEMILSSNNYVTGKSDIDHIFWLLVKDDLILKFGKYMQEEHDFAWTDIFQLFINQFNIYANSRDQVIVLGNMYRYLMTFTLWLNISKFVKVMKDKCEELTNEISFRRDREKFTKICKDFNEYIDEHSK